MDIANAKRINDDNVRLINCDINIAFIGLYLSIFSAFLVINKVPIDVHNAAIKAVK